MPLTKEYARYKANGNFNIIASPHCNPALVNLQGQEGRYVAVAACEEIIVWDLRIGTKALVLSGDKHEVTCLRANPSKDFLAAGYSNGIIKIYDLEKAEVQTEFVGHKSAITCLNYDYRGLKLASGSKDTEVIVWDVVAESGLHRLSGHRGVITQVKFMETKNVIVSSSKDTFIKFWDLETAHCFHTLVGHSREVWDFTLLNEDKYIATGSFDNELRVWLLNFKEDNFINLLNIVPQEIESEDIIADPDSPLIYEKAGSILRSGKGRVVSMVSDNTNTLFACHGIDNTIELFSILPENEAKIRALKRQRKERKKNSSNMKENEEMKIDKEEDEKEKGITLKDQIKRWSIIKTSNKVKGIDLIVRKGKELRMVSVCYNNSLEFHSLTFEKKTSEPQLLTKITQHGHHSEIRGLAFSSDNQAIVSASAEAVKLWNRASLTCIRTISLTNAYAVSVCFAPGDRHVLVGLKDGRLLIIDIAGGEIMEEINAHGGSELWSISLTRDERGCVTGGGDKTVKFWDFELINDPQKNIKVLSLIHIKTLVLEESVLACKISPNNKFIAVSLLDCTVKIFFLDTFKFFLSLYGHKLPVLCLDISHDSKLIATGSADRNVKLWGLDFGDCHRSLFAHEDSITALQFVPKTKLFFTCGKDGQIKQWDGESFEKIVTLEGHHGEAWNLVISPNGRHVISCGSDRVLRHFEKTSDPLILEDEAEEERARAEQEELLTGPDTNVLGAPTLNLPTRKTAGSEKASEELIECIRICKEYRNETKSEKDGKKPPIPPIMQVYGVKTASEFLIHILSRIKTSELEESLLLLPLDVVYDLLREISLTLEHAGHRIELLCRVMILLFKVHHGPITTSKELLTVVKKLQNHAFEKITYLRDLVGVNYHGLMHIQREFEERESIQIFRDATIERRNREKRRRKKDKIAKHAVITM